MPDGSEEFGHFCELSVDDHVNRHTGPLVTELVEQGHGLDDVAQPGDV